jgi:hypothetical protein
MLYETFINHFIVVQIIHKYAIMAVYAVNITSYKTVT